LTALDILSHSRIIQGCGSDTSYAQPSASYKFAVAAHRPA
jgi:hypothetical protein